MWKIIFIFSFIISFIFLYRNADLVGQSYDEYSVMGPRNHTDLYNAMIYPFTRIVVYGAIWYQGRE